MFSTSFAMLAASGLLSNGMAIQPTWTTDYSKAVRAASEQHKPIAVFITAGDAGRIVQDGSLPAEACKLLRDSYIAFHIDTTTTQGKELASQFQVTEGIVISDRSGEKQAFRFHGAMKSTDVNTYLEQYAKTTVISTTVSVGEVQVIQPVTHIQPVVTPGSYNGYYSNPVIYGNSSCPNCRSR